MFKSLFIIYLFHLFISHATARYIQSGTTTGLVINHITLFRAQHTFECTCTYTYTNVALLWLLYHTALVLPSCFPYAFHQLVPPVGPIISCRAYFISSVQVSLCVFMCACLLLSLRERDRESEWVSEWERERDRERESECVSFAGSSHIQVKIPSWSASCLISLRSSSSVGKVSAVNLSSHSLWVIVCLSGHAGNSVEAVLNNNRIILVYGRGETQEGVVCPWIPLQSPAKCTLHRFSWLSGGCLKVVLSAHIHYFHLTPPPLTIPSLYKLCVPIQVMCLSVPEQNLPRLQGSILTRATHTSKNACTHGTVRHFG